MVTDDLDTIKMMLYIGLGWGVLPRSLLGDGQLRILNVQHPPLNRDLGIIYHRQRNLSNAARAFLQRIRRSEERRVGKEGRLEWVTCGSRRERRRRGRDGVGSRGV